MKPFTSLFHAFQIQRVLHLYMAEEDATPFPVPVKIYDETLSALCDAAHLAKIGNTGKLKAVKKLTKKLKKVLPQTPILML